MTGVRRRVVRQTERSVLVAVGSRIGVAGGRTALPSGRMILHAAMGWRVCGNRYKNGLECGCCVGNAATRVPSVAVIAIQHQKVRMRAFGRRPVCTEGVAIRTSGHGGARSDTHPMPAGAAASRSRKAARNRQSHRPSRTAFASGRSLLMATRIILLEAVGLEEWPAAAGLLHDEGAERAVPRTGNVITSGITLQLYAIPPLTEMICEVT